MDNLGSLTSVFTKHVHAQHGLQKYGGNNKVCSFTSQAYRESSQLP